MAEEAPAARLPIPSGSPTDIATDIGRHEYGEAIPPGRSLLEAPETDPQFWADMRGVVLDDPPRLSTCFRHTGWKRERRLVVESLSRTGQADSRIREFTECGSHAYVLQSVSEPVTYRLAGSSCHDRFCLPCGNERSHAIALNVIDQIAEKQIRFLTLTLKSADEPLALLLDKLYDCFQKLRRRAFWKKRVAGGVAFLEVTWNDKRQRWHPHFHILIEGRFIPIAGLKKLWYELTGDSYIIDLRLVKDHRHAAQYVTKYATKPFNNTFVNRPDRLDEAVCVLRGRKLALTFGSWRGVTLARTIADGAWEHFATLEDVIYLAALGDVPSRELLATFTDHPLDDLYARAPPTREPPHLPAATPEQLTWFGAWTADGTYRHAFAQ